MLIKQNTAGVYFDVALATQKKVNYLVVLKSVESLAAIGNSFSSSIICIVSAVIYSLLEQMHPQII